MSTAKPMATPAQLAQLRWQQSEEEWSNGVLFGAPESWDGDDAAESIALDYVTEMERRMDLVGISRERWVDESEISRLAAAFRAAGIKVDE